MIDKTNIIEAVMARLKNIPVGHYIDLRTYKRNRSVMVIKNTEDDMLVIEEGYSKEQFRVKSEKLKKLLAALLRKEFPRSRKIRLYSMGSYTEEEAVNTRRKIL
jgi:hypothetical protein